MDEKFRFMFGIGEVLIRGGVFVFLYGFAVSL